MNADHKLDAKGLACPMPIVRTKKAMANLQEGEILQITTTDKGSMADIPAWCKSTGNEYLSGSEDGNVQTHYVKRTERKKVAPAGDVKSISNEELEAKMKTGPVILLDVREPEEYAGGHIPGAHSVPLAQVEQYIAAIPASEPVYVLCKSGMRSQMACDNLMVNGRSNIIRVAPGMSEWNGPITSELLATAGMK
ncbi:sulfurtransferase TusA family protein [Jeotgalibacillus aurantiacus]|uniref:sulfurtransferase TusA family protein n=1 Tax=Jeotgalibacillus aurantiacus TaxID=2763266 RepID=UPI001D0B2372|nr:sulfurtransferase TusA family protein [Jeotgalibacillus aurantiacus]